MEKLAMTPQRLGQLQYLNREIVQRKKWLCQLRALAQGRGGKVEGLPYLAPRDAQGKYAPQIKALEESTARRLEQSLEEARVLQEFIDGVEDSRMRLLLSLRYVNGLTWKQVAFRMGYFDEQVPRRRHTIFFKGQKEVAAGGTQT